MKENINTPEIQVPETVLLKAEPLQGQERIEILDVIRGFALLGILIVNMAMFNSPDIYFQALRKSICAGFLDTVASGFINLFVQGKFYTIFAFLFGLGFVIFFERAQAKTTKPKRLFYRRIFILLLIGLIHAFFIWSGDILVAYALLGFLLPLFFNRSSKTLIVWAITLVAVLVAFMALIMGVAALANTVDPNIMGDTRQELFADMEARIASSFQAYGHGSFSEIQAQRVSDTLFLYRNGLFTSFFVIFPLFLLGVYAGKKAIFQNIEANLPMIKKVWMWGLIIGLTMSVVKFMSRNLMAGDPFSFHQVIFLGAGFLGDLGLALFFMASLVLLYQNRKWFLRLKPLSYMGRMALSNYLFQSIVCILIFYNFGLGLYGQVGTALGLALAIFIFIVQIFISRLWLKHYQYGPVEWLWKSLTYGKFFKMRNN